MQLFHFLFIRKQCLIYSQIEVVLVHVVQYNILHPLTRPKGLFLLSKNRRCNHGLHVLIFLLILTKMNHTFI